MSTTSSWNVAVGFVLQADSVSLGAAPHSLVLRIVVPNAMQFGAPIKWVSINPQEDEVLFPPITFLQPTGRYQIEQVGPTRLTVLEVSPHV